MSEDFGQLDSPLKLQPTPKWVFVSIAIAGIVFLLALGTLLFNVYVGNAQGVDLFTGILSGISTIILVILTGWYATETRNLVRVSEETRRDEQQRSIRRRQEEVDTLRRSLLGEIRTIEGFEEYAEMYIPSLSRRYDLIPTEIYEANASDIGRLTSTEVEVILDYYGTVRMLENALHMQRLEDTTAGKDAIKHYFIGSKYVFDEIIRWVTRGYIAPEERDARTEHVKEVFRGLAEAQEDAIAEIENHINT